MICNICNKPVVLMPSAAERAKRYGGHPADYTALFPQHGQCVVDKRNQQVRELLQ